MTPFGANGSIPLGQEQAPQDMPGPVLVAGGGSLQPLQASGTQTVAAAMTKRVSLNAKLPRGH